MKERDLFEDPVARRFPAPGWLQYLGLALGAIAAVFLAIFFFAVFAALFVAGSIGLGAWFWWIRRKIRRAAASGQPLEGEYRVIEKQTYIIERKDPSD